jgi:hypothetical protein
MSGVMKFDLSHKINSLSFGDEKDFKSIKSDFHHKEDTLTPLDGKRKEFHNNEMNKVYEYYLKVL